MKKAFNFLFLVIIVFFLSLYFSRYKSDYYDNKNILTKEAIEQFEKDVKDGKQIIAKNYIPEEKDYSNKVSSFGIKTSNVIEDTFHKGLKAMMSYLNGLENNWHLKKKMI